MLTAAQMIIDLDASLLRRGKAVTIRRVGTPNVDVAVRGQVKVMSADELHGVVDQGNVRVIVSPTGLASLLPLRKGDKVLINSVPHNIELVKPHEVDSTLVRLVLMVKG